MMEHFLSTSTDNVIFAKDRELGQVPPTIALFQCKNMCRDLCRALGHIYWGLWENGFYLVYFYNRGLCLVLSAAWYLGAAEKYTNKNFWFNVISYCLVCTKLLNNRHGFQ